MLRVSIPSAALTVALFLVVGAAGVDAAADSAPAPVDPARLFVRQCAPCHGQDGRAQTPMARNLGVRDLTVSTAEPEVIQQAILEGRRNSRGALAMPAYAGKLTAGEVDALVAYLLSLRPT